MSSPGENLRAMAAAERATVEARTNAVRVLDIHDLLWELVDVLARCYTTPPDRRTR